MLLDYLVSASTASSLERPAPSCLDSCLFCLFLIGEVVSWRFAQALPYVACFQSRSAPNSLRSADFAFVAFERLPLHSC